MIKIVISEAKRRNQKCKPETRTSHFWKLPTGMDDLGSGKCGLDNLLTRACNTSTSVTKLGAYWTCHNDANHTHPLPQQLWLLRVADAMVKYLISPT